MNELAERMGVRLQILDNHPPNCPGQANGCFLSELDLAMPESLAPDLASGDFKLYFSSVSPVIEADSDAFAVRLINGDLHVLEPKAGATLQPGKTYPTRLWSQGHFFSAFYPMPNMFLVSGKLAPAVIAATRPTTDPDSKLEVLPFVAPMTDEAKLATQSSDDQTRWQTPERAFALYAKRAVDAAPSDIAIIPTPASFRQIDGPALDLTRGVHLMLSGIDRTALDPAVADLGFPESSSGVPLQIRLSTAMSPESYRLDARSDAIEIEAADAAGARYALESLAQQIAYEHGSLRPLTIEDAPRFGFRGLHIDLARNFHSKGEVLEVIAQMARYKLNKLHLHLGDDEGWRLEIARLPELTEVGGYRCYDPTETRCLLPQLGAGPNRDTPVNGYLSQADYVEILKAAQARGIEVIPSFDMPGHSRAAIHSMEARYRRLIAQGRKAEAERFRLVEPGDTTQYRSVQNYNDNTLNVCLDSTYRFIDAVIDDIKALHASAGVPLRTYHIGADETAGAWSGSPACKALMARTGRTVEQLGPMFIERVSTSLARKGIEAAGWSDGLNHVDPAKMPTAVQSNIWGDLFTAAPAEAHRAANLGWKTVVAVPNVLYFDIPYAAHPLERGYDWPSRGTDTFKVFSFLPENLPANASVMKDILSTRTTVTDKEPLKAGRSMTGVQANMWSETVRRDSLVEYMLFPRVLAVAERAWRRAPWEPAYRPGASYSYGDGKVSMAALERDWNSFAAKMPAQFGALERAGIMYRLAPPGARIVDGTLEANSEFPGQPIEYRSAGGAWTRYSAPVRVSGPVQLRTRTYDGQRASRVVEVGGS
ncbi:family 20 glycosylhydrolase [Sphingomonas segetis]|uniref:family 20 glycosylhydrolase n=1 Tax=Sphingomonas segetis TaxID=1104779 RepID=UPI001E29C97E|nr:family 20 glycosylhydrolase [Sphingomonas segetis]